MLHETTALRRRVWAIAAAIVVGAFCPMALMAQSSGADNDKTAPSVTIVAPMPATGYSYSPIEVGGTAADSGTPASGVDVVEVSVDNGEWRKAIGTTSWRLWVDLLPGKNTISVRAADKVGNWSLVASVDTMFWGAAATGGDADDDGVSDGQDQCPETPADQEVNSQGCAASQRDSDGDSITDDLDQCPDTPLGDTVDATGCEPLLDADEDGVDDLHDRCPGTAPGQDVDPRGCSLSQTDTDGDGIADDADGCPQDPRKAAPGECGCGKPELAGCGVQVTLRVTTDRPVPTGISGAVVYPYGLEVEVWAPEPPNGCHFDRWSGDVMCCENPVRLLMNCDKVVQAHYVADDPDTDEVEEVAAQVPETPTTPACGAGMLGGVLMSFLGLGVLGLQRRSRRIA